jgi:tetratricopeptide (TPR) repeat protein
MKAYVFTDKALQRHAGQFVWLSLDVEKPQNAVFRKKYATDALPMFFVVDPRTEQIALRWVGGASVPQLQKILADGLTAVKGGSGRGVAEVLARADRHYAAADYEKAAAEYREALRLAPPGWTRSARATESLLFALYQTKDYAGCADAARDVFPRFEKTSSAANVAASGLSCALELPAEDASRAGLVKDLAAASRKVVASPRKDLAADDISGVYETLAQEREDAKDEEGKKQVLRERATFLEAAAARAKTPEARAVFDSHRVATYLELGEPERAIPMLQASERDLPNDYNPPARLALAYKAMKKYDEALAASDRALAKAYGPRKIQYLQTRSDIYKEMGNVAEAKKAMQQAIELAEALPDGQRSERFIASLKKKLESL